MHLLHTQTIQFSYVQFMFFVPHEFKLDRKRTERYLPRKQHYAIRVTISVETIYFITLLCLCIR